MQYQYYRNVSNGRPSHGSFTVELCFPEVDKDLSGCMAHHGQPAEPDKARPIMHQGLRCDSRVTSGVTQVRGRRGNAWKVFLSGLLYHRPV